MSRTNRRRIAIGFHHLTSCGCGRTRRNPRQDNRFALVFQVLSRKQTAVVSSFDIAHDRLMHLFIVRKDLGSYRHEHPRHDGNGTFRLTHVFPSAGEYHLFADVAPQSAGSQVLMAKLLVAGEPGKEFNIRAAPAEARSFTKTAERMGSDIAAGGRCRAGARVDAV